MSQIIMKILIDYFGDPGLIVYEYWIDAMRPFWEKIARKKDIFAVFVSRHNPPISLGHRESMQDLNCAIKNLAGHCCKDHIMLVHKVTINCFAIMLDWSPYENPCGNMRAPFAKDLLYFKTLPKYTALPRLKARESLCEQWRAAITKLLSIKNSNKIVPK